MSTRIRRPFMRMTTIASFPSDSVLLLRILELRASAGKGNLRGMKFDYNQYFERRLELCGRELVLKGTRVTVRTLLASLAEESTAEEIRADFPAVTAEALRAVVAFAAASAEEDMPVPPIPAVV